jgi:protein SCO1/2
MKHYLLHSIFRFAACFTLAFWLMEGAILAQVVKEHDPALDGIDVEEKLSAMLPLDVPLVDETGKAVTFGDYFKADRPVVLMFAYYQCPMLCNLVMNGVVQSIDSLSLSMGKDFQIVTVSIKPSETPQLAAAKKTNYMESLNRPADDPGWAFLTAPEESSKRLADAAGFRYYYDADRGEYAHPAVVILVSPEGKLTRYLYGIQIEEKDMKLALVEASNGKVGSTLDKLILYCYHYDPESKGYVVLAGTIMKIGGIFMLLFTGSFVYGLWRWEKRRGGSNRWASYTHRPYAKER